MGGREGSVAYDQHIVWGGLQGEKGIVKKRGLEKRKRL